MHSENKVIQKLLKSPFLKKVLMAVNLAGLSIVAVWYLSICHVFSHFPQFSAEKGLKMSLLLTKLTTKREIDLVIRQTEDKVVVLRFGKESDLACMQLDEILSKTILMLANMAEIRCIDVDAVPIYRDYFDITLTPATIFFFNAQHMKVDYGTPDHTKFIGTFKNKQDFINLIEIIYRGAMKGKVMVTSPIAYSDVTKYDLLYKNF